MEKRYSRYLLSFFKYITTLYLFFSYSAYAIVIGPNTIISTSTTISNTTVDLTAGNFIVKEGATLTLQNNTITGTLSAANPNLISVERGTLTMLNNRVSIDTSSITPMPGTEATYYAIRLGRASTSLIKNEFIANQPLRGGLLTTSLILPANNITIDDNSFENFHGVLYLLNSHNTNVLFNLFKLNSSGNLVIVGSNAAISDNRFYFSGRNKLGDAIDIIDSENIKVTKNVVFTPTSQGIAVVLSRDLVIDSNTISGGITYAINLLSNEGIKNSSPYLANVISGLQKQGLKHRVTNDITISRNFMSQNRYGIAATNVDNLTVTGNYFSQRFNSIAERKFWTDNSILLRNVTALLWQDNFYKEAFTQENGGDNSLTENIVPFPATGGITL